MAKTVQHDYRQMGLSPDAVALLLKIPMHTRPDVYAAQTGDDGDGCPVPCGAPGCGAIIPLAQSHAGRIAHSYTNGIAPASKCRHELADSGQHFACSLEHLRAALLACWDSHLTPAIQAALNPPPPSAPAELDRDRFPARDDAPVASLPEAPASPAAPPPIVHKF